MKDELNLYNELTAVNEAYFKENIDLVHAQMYLSRLRRKYIAPYYQRSHKITTDPDLKGFETSMAKAFGLDTFALNIDNSNVMNAGTFPVYYGYEDRNWRGKIRVTPTGYRFDKSAEAIVITHTSTGLMCSEDITDREVMAIFLHEIGHSFACKNNKINVMADIGNALTLVSGLALLFMAPAVGITILLMGSSTLRKVQERLATYIEENYPNLNEIINAITFMVNNIFNILREGQFITSLFAIPGVGAMFNVLYNVIMTKIRYVGLFGPSYIMMQIYGYPNEQFADGFAAMYGYGPDLATGLDKLHNPGYQNGLTAEVLRKKAPLLMAYYDLTILPFVILITPFDEHPALVERIQGNVRLLKKEASKTDNPVVKKRINQDIARIEKMMDENYNPKNVAKLTNSPMYSNVASRMYTGLVLSLFGGDFRHHISDFVFGAQDSLSRDDDAKFSRG